eukprot:Awhi_evm1s2867
MENFVLGVNKLSIVVMNAKEKIGKKNTNTSVLRLWILVENVTHLDGDEHIKYCLKLINDKEETLNKINPHRQKYMNF